ncbi:peptidase C45 [Candidatus Bathyarchaeota archaeon]|nr:peptidase C45 [Candidatus Bathyarchaeota archaeon]
MAHTREDNVVREKPNMSGHLPVLVLRGSPHEIGYRHGTEARDKIKHNLEIYFQRFKNETALSREEALKRAERYLEVIRRTSPDYATAMEGIALGSRMKLLEITALNVRYELMYSQFAKIGLKHNPLPDGCTAFGAMPEATVRHHLILAQNWDWIPQVEGLFLKIRPRKGPKVLCFTEAGVVGGKIGLNSEGVGLAINGLVSNEDDWERLRKPFHVRCWEILNSKTLGEAMSKVTRGQRSCSANFLIGEQKKLGAAKLVDIESAPRSTLGLSPKNGIATHTNHFSQPDKLGIKQVLDEERRSTLHRFRRVNQLVKPFREGQEKLSLRTAEGVLKDHDGRPESVCRHPNTKFPQYEQYQTVVSVVMDLYTGEVRASQGSPCEYPHRALRL